MNHDIAYKVDDDGDNIGDDGDDGDDDGSDYENTDALLQSLIHAFSLEQNLATIFSMFNPYLFRQESTERQFFKILLFTLKSILLSARQCVVAGPQML